MTEILENGNVESADNEGGTADDRRDFARRQVEFLKENGIRDPLVISRIFKTAGPGQIREAWTLAMSETDSVRVDLLDCVLTGVRGSQDFGIDRMIAVMKACSFYIPKAFNAHCFFRVLDGALEMLVPGSFEFTDEEITQMKMAINRNRGEDEDGDDR